jgi:hypothetical protein
MFASLPLAAVIGGNTLIVHGGAKPLAETLSTLPDHAAVGNFLTI